MSRVEETIKQADKKMKTPLIASADDIGNVDTDYYKGSEEIVKSASIVAKINKEFPRMMDDFDDIQRSMLQVFCEKQDDYGPSNIGLGKATVESEEDVAHSLTGLIIRMSDKIHRLLHLDKEKKNPNNESIDDTLTDIANYCVMAQIVRRGNWGK